MRIRRIVNRRFKKDDGRSTVAGAVNAAVSVNVNEPGEQRTSVSSRQRVVQRGGRTEVYEEREERSP